MTLADLDLDKMYTYADYYKWKFEERVELIKGRIFKMSPGPNRMHQEVAGKMHLILGSFLKNSSCKVYIAPFDVRLSRKSNDDKDIVNVFQPDLCVVCDRSKLDARGCVGAPDIVVEILSPSNSKKELKNKYEVYEEVGVKEYWVVMPSERTMMVYLLIDGQYQPSRLMAHDDVVTSAVLPGFSLNVTDLFADADEEEQW